MVSWIWVLIAAAVGFLAGTGHALWTVWRKYDVREKGE